MKRVLKAVDLCCGAGGWAAAAAGLPIEFVCVVDWAADCLETWRVNHQAAHPKCAIVEADLAQLHAAIEIFDLARGADLVLGGIPCEQVSVVRATPLPSAELETWYALIDSLFAIVREVRPRAWCFEDVIQIEKHLTGSLLAGVGPYHVQRINARYYGPQNRLRSFIGRFPRVAPPQVPPAESSDWSHLLDRGPHRTLTRHEELERREYGGTLSIKAGDNIARVMNPQRACATIVAKWDNGGNNKRKFMVVDKDDRLRMLTWQEAARVQGFPDDYLFAASWTRTREMVGRAIPIQVGRAILTEICREAEARPP